VLALPAALRGIPLHRHPLPVPQRRFTERQGVSPPGNRVLVILIPHACHKTSLVSNVLMLESFLSSGVHPDDLMLGWLNVFRSRWLLVPNQDVTRQGGPGSAPVGIFFNLWSLRPYRFLLMAGVCICFRLGSCRGVPSRRHPNCFRMASSAGKR
jgi:hypothetical protein